MSNGPYIELGPIPSMHVRAFVGFARGLVTQFSEDPVLSLTFTPTITSSINAMFDSWADIATSDTFQWSASMPTDHAEYLLYALFLALQARRNELGGAPNGRDVDARRPFVVHLIERFTSALALTPDADHPRLAHLRESWPEDFGL